jgi:hypothetical protein
MKILTTLTVSGGLNMASAAKDVFTIGTPLENNDGNVDDLYVYANADFKNNVILGSSSSDIVVFNGRINSNIVPTASGTFSLGSSDRPFKEIFVGSGSISIASPTAAPATTISNNNGNLDISAGGVRIVGTGSFVGSLQGTASHAATASSYYVNISQAGDNDGTTYPIAYAFSSNATGKSVNILSLKQGTNITLSQSVGNLTVDVDQTAWTAYTPTWTAASTNPVIGNGTIQGYYKVIGKTCFVRGNIAMGSTTTFGSGEWYVSMPFTASHADAILMTVTLLDNGSAWYNATLNGARAGFNTKAAMQFVNHNNGTAGDVNATNPFTWTNTDRFIWNGSYQIA